jgi:predicted ABC-type ATPase
LAKAIIIGGANGAGKTTFAREFLPSEGAALQFVNADYLAAGISPLLPNSANIASGRAVMERIRELVQSGEDFAIESTLSGKWLAKQIPEWKRRGYTVELYFLELDTPELAIQRVKRRVAEGGHNIFDDVVVRRYHRGKQLFHTLYKPLVESWVIIDNSGSEPIIVEEGSNHA